jgi:hypothetical protein
MSHPRIAWFCLALSLFACDRSYVTVDGRPGLAGPRRTPLPVTPRGTPDEDLDGDPDLAVSRRALVLRGAAAIEGRRLGQGAPHDEPELLVDLLGGLSLGGVPNAGDARVDAWLDAARPRSGRPRVGDLAVFRGRGKNGVPHVGIVVAQHTDGLVEVLGATRDAWRRIRIHPKRPAVRRDEGRILNTFIRTRRPDDAPGERYLAGQLLEGFYTLLD